VRAALRSAELRRIVRHIDRAVDGEAALVAALTDARFDTFASEVLAVLREKS
jgi:hypothetical protein